MNIEHVLLAPASRLVGGPDKRGGMPSDNFTVTGDPEKFRGRANFTRKELPTTIRLGMVVVMRGGAFEGHDGAEHQLAMEVFGPDRSRIGRRLNTAFKVDMRGPESPADLAITQLRAVARFPAEVFGTYSVEIRVDGGAPHSSLVGVRNRPFGGCPGD